MTLPTLSATGVEILLVYGAKLHPPRNGNPGMRAMVFENGDVLVSPVGYPDKLAAAEAMHKAIATCLAAGLQVALRSGPGFITRKRPRA